MYIFGNCNLRKKTIFMSPGVIKETKCVDFPRCGKQAHPIKLAVLFECNRARVFDVIFHDLSYYWSKQVDTKAN